MMTQRNEITKINSEPSECELRNATILLYCDSTELFFDWEHTPPVRPHISFGVDSQSNMVVFLSLSITPPQRPDLASLVEHAFGNAAIKDAGVVLPVCHISPKTKWIQGKD